MSYTRVSQIFLLSAIWVSSVVGLAAASPTEAAVVVQMIQNGSPKNRIDLVILGDGYRAKQMEKFKKDAKTFAKYLFKQSPFLEYRRYFNVLRIETPSRDSGASKPNKPKRTVYDARFACYANYRNLCVDNDKVTAVLQKNLESDRHDMVIVIVNDPEYGGSGGPYAVASTHEYGRIIAVHEFGHSFGHLDDEYVEEEVCGMFTPWGFNVTQKRKRPRVPWKIWIRRKQQIPTPGDKDRGTGLYEGALICPKDWFRPTYDSKMNSLLAPSFGPVNSEQLVRRIYETIRPIDLTKPKRTKIKLAEDESRIFKVRVADRRLKSLRTVWRMNGTIISREKQVVISHADIGEGAALALSVSDATPMVRFDPNNVLVESTRWRILPK